MSRPRKSPPGPHAVVGGRIKEAREKVALTREQLAVKAGISGSTLMKIEQGHGGRLSTLEAIADALGVELSTLLAAA